LYYLISFYLKLGKIVIVKEGNSPVNGEFFYVPLSSLNSSSSKRLSKVFI